jgi:hypothetical protein
MIVREIGSERVLPATLGLRTIGNGRHHCSEADMRPSGGALLWVCLSFQSLDRLATSTDLVADSRCARQVRLSHLRKLHLSFSHVKEAAAL